MGGKKFKAEGQGKSWKQVGLISHNHTQLTTPSHHQHLVYGAAVSIVVEQHVCSQKFINKRVQLSIKAALSSDSVQ